MDRKWNWDLAKFNRVFGVSVKVVKYVSYISGSDLNGDGTKENPYATTTKAALALKNEGYTSKTGLIIYDGDEFTQCSVTNANPYIISNTTGSLLRAPGAADCMSYYISIYKKNPSNSYRTFYYVDTTNLLISISSIFSSNCSLSQFYVGGGIDPTSFNYSPGNKDEIRNHGIIVNCCASSSISQSQSSIEGSKSSCLIANGCFALYVKSLTTYASATISVVRPLVTLTRDSYMLFNNTTGLPLTTVSFTDCLYVDDYYTEGMTSAELTLAIYNHIKTTVEDNGGTMSVSESAFCAFFGFSLYKSEDILSYSGGKLIYCNTERLIEAIGINNWNRGGLSTLLGDNISFKELVNFSGSGMYITFDNTKESGTAMSSIIKINPHEESILSLSLPSFKWVYSNNGEDDILYSPIKVFGDGSPISGTDLESTIPAGMYIVNKDCVVDSESVLAGHIFNFTTATTHTFVDSGKAYDNTSSRTLGIFPIEHPYTQNVGLVRFKKESEVTTINAGDTLDSDYWYINNGSADCELSNGDVITSGDSYHCTTSGVTVSSGTCVQTFADDDVWIPVNMNDRNLDYYVDSDGELIDSTVKDIDGNYLKYAKPINSDAVEVSGNKRITRINAMYSQFKLYAQKTHFNDL